MYYIIFERKTLEKIIEQYRILLNKLNSYSAQFPEKKTVLFNAKAGIKYDQEIMLIGRAVNGFDYRSEFNVNGKQDKMDSLLKYLHENIHTETEKIVGKYNPNRSAFTRMKRIITAKYCKVEPKVAYQYHLWSNLYKIAGYDGGNPSRKLCVVQFPECLRILEMEIEKYQPKRILMMTGSNWADDFINAMKLEKIMHRNKAYVDYSCIRNNIKIVVAKHPQGKPQDQFAKEVFQAFDE